MTDRDVVDALTALRDLVDATHDLTDAVDRLRIELIRSLEELREALSDA
jgi:hypothetical protein